MADYSIVANAISPQSNLAAGQSSANLTRIIGALDTLTKEVQKTFLRSAISLLEFGQRARIEFNLPAQVAFSPRPKEFEVASPPGALEQ